MPTENLNCPRCGAALKVTLNNQLVTCTYCHSTIHISTSKSNDLYLPEEDIQIAPPSSEEAPRLAEITQALTRLLQSNDGSSVVIFSESTSEKFVQFKKPLILDLPFNLLNKQDIERATAFFRKLGVSGPEVQNLYYIPNGNGFTSIVPNGNKIVSTAFFFKFDFGKDVDRAAQITLAIFRQVYQFPIDFKLIIQKV